MVVPAFVSVPASVDCQVPNSVPVRFRRNGTAVTTMPSTVTAVTHFHRTLSWLPLGCSGIPQSIDQLSSSKPRVLRFSRIAVRWSSVNLSSWSDSMSRETRIGIPLVTKWETISS